MKALLGAQLGCRLRLLDLVSFSRLEDVSQHWSEKHRGYFLADTLSACFC